jgi:hypothetical protein
MQYYFADPAPGSCNSGKPHIHPLQSRHPILTNVRNQVVLFGSRVVLFWAAALEDHLCNAVQHMQMAWPYLPVHSATCSPGPYICPSVHLSVCLSVCLLIIMFPGMVPCLQSPSLKSIGYSGPICHAEYDIWSHFARYVSWRFAFP